MRNLILALCLVCVFTGDSANRFNATAAGKDNTMTETQAQQESAPIKCELDAMTPTERKRYEALKTQLRKAKKETRELPNGFAFRFEPALLMSAAEFISKESKCCSFYTFSLEQSGSKGPLWLRITGPKEAKSFIKDALA